MQSLQNIEIQWSFIVSMQKETKDKGKFFYIRCRKGKQLKKLLLSPGDYVCMSLHLTTCMVGTVNLILN